MKKLVFLLSVALVVGLLSFGGNLSTIDDGPNPSKVEYAVIDDGPNPSMPGLSYAKADTNYKVIDDGPNPS